jgi:lipid II:glycine glycyltransferase (peptidoglycan interpeptide bridge formation enzyme)
MIIYKAHGITIGEEWFNPPQLNLLPHLDIFQAIQIQNIPLNTEKTQSFYTIVLDLTQDIPDLIGACNDTTRYEIKHANANDNLVYIYNDNDAELKKFVLFYNEFAKAKSLLPINVNKLKAYSMAGNLLLTKSVSKDNNVTLVYHAYYCSKNRVRLLNSASLYRETVDKQKRKQIGMANRWLHWQDILYFKQQGINIYDFGGWYNGKSDKEKISINRFKEGFGGKIIKGYNYQYGLTIKGKMYLLVKKIYDFIRH